MFEDLLSSMTRKTTESYEQLLERALEPYGINRQNIEENAHRVNIVQHHSVSELFQTIDEFYIDDQYAFSIQKVLRHEERAPGVMAMVMDVKVLKGEGDA